MRIKTITDKDTGCRINLSTDRVRNLNFIVGELGAGVVELSDRIQAHLRHGTENGVGLDLVEGRPCDADLVFVFGIGWMRDVLLGRLQFQSVRLHEVVQKANRMLAAIGGVFEHECNLLEQGDRRIFFPRGLAAGPSDVVTLVAMVAAREQVTPCLPLAIVFPQNSLPRFALRVLEVLSKNVEQVLVFASGPLLEFKSFDSIPPDTPIPSSYLSYVSEPGHLSVLDVLEHRGMLGLVWRLGSAA